MGNNEQPVYPKVVFERARSDYRELSEQLNDAEWEMGSAEALMDHIFHANFPQPYRPTIEGMTLAGRTQLVATLAVERCVSLANGLASEIDSNRLFSAAAIARSLMELVGTLVLMREGFEGCDVTTSTAREYVDDETMRFLVASRSLNTGGHEILRTDKMINAAKKRYGDEFGADYGYLSDHAHPNAFGVFGLTLIEESATIAIKRRPPIDRDAAELLLKVLAVGLHSVLHDAFALVEWAEARNCELRNITD